MTVDWAATGQREPIIFKKSAAWDGVKVKHCRVLPGSLAEHSCPDHLISVPLEGSFIASAQSATGRQRGACRSVGHACIVPSGQPYSAQWDGEMEYFSILLEPALIARHASDSLLPEQVELVPACGVNDPLIRHIGLALVAEAEAAGPAPRLYVDSLTNALAVHLLRHYSTAGERPAPAGGLTGRRLRRVTEFMAEHLDQDLTLVEIAGVADLSPSHFTRAFKQATGLSPHQYLIKLRVERAKQLLARSGLPLMEVALRTGFKTQCHFTTLFRRHTALTPKAYRDCALG